MAYRKTFRKKTRRNKRRKMIRGGVKTPRQSAKAASAAAFRESAKASRRDAVLAEQAEHRESSIDRRQESKLDIRLSREAHDELSQFIRDIKAQIYPIFRNLYSVYKFYLRTNNVKAKNLGLALRALTLPSPTALLANLHQEVDHEYSQIPAPNRPDFTINEQMIAFDTAKAEIQTIINNHLLLPMNEFRKNAIDKLTLSLRYLNNFMT
jgi:hypothetical protein